MEELLGEVYVDFLDVRKLGGNYRNNPGKNSIRKPRRIPGGIYIGIPVVMINEILGGISVEPVKQILVEPLIQAS